MNAKKPLPKHEPLTVRGRLSPEVEQAIREDDLVCLSHETLRLARGLLRDFQGGAEHQHDDPTDESTLVLAPMRR